MEIDVNAKEIKSIKVYSTDYAEDDLEYFLRELDSNEINRFENLIKTSSYPDIDFMETYIFEIENLDGEKYTVLSDWENIRVEDGVIFKLNNPFIMGDLVYGKKHSENPIVALLNFKKDKPSIYLLKDLIYGNDGLNIELIGKADILFDEFINKLINHQLNKSSKKEHIKILESIIIKLNKLNEEFDFIETLEREYICDFITSCFQIVGFSSDIDKRIEMLKMW